MNSQRTITTKEVFIGYLVLTNFLADAEAPQKINTFACHSVKRWKHRAQVIDFLPRLLYMVVSKMNKSRSK